MRNLASPRGGLGLAGLCITVLMSLAAQELVGQTPLVLENVASGARARAVAANNPWVGAQLSLRLQGSSEISDLLIGSATIMYELPMGSRRFALPVLGNFGSLKSDASGGATPKEQARTKAQELLEASRGLHVGLYPYVILHDKGGVLLSGHGVVGYKANSYRNPTDTSQRVLLQQLRLSLGVEVQLGNRADGRKPVTISLAAVNTRFEEEKYLEAFGERKSSLTSFETTVVVPITAGTGFLVEWIQAADRKGGVRAGMVLAGEAH